MPEPRNLNSELGGILAQVPQFASSAYNLQQQYGPQYLQSSLFGSGDNPGLLESLGLTSEQINALNAQSATATRANAFADAGMLDATKRATNGELYNLMSYGDAMAMNPRGATANEGAISGAARGLLAPTAGEAGLYNLTAQGGLVDTLNQNALADLRLGSRLTDAEVGQVQQNTRRSFAARGLYDSTPAIASEILNLDQMGQQRLAQRTSAANSAASLSGGLYNLSANTTTNRIGTAIGGMATADQLASSREAQNFNNVLSSIGYRSGTATDPLALLNSNAGPNQTSATDVFGLSTAFGGTMPDTLGGLLSYGSDLYNTNFNAQASQEIANANNKAATKSAIGSGVVTIGAAAIIAF